MGGLKDGSSTDGRFKRWEFKRREVQKMGVQKMGGSTEGSSKHGGLKRWDLKDGGSKIRGMKDGIFKDERFKTYEVQIMEGSRHIKGWKDWRFQPQVIVPYSLYSQCDFIVSTVEIEQNGRFSFLATSFAKMIFVFALKIVPIKC